MFIVGVLLVVLWVIIVLMSRSITTFFHEMGHAIPALIFTKEPVEVYVGSYGDISKSIKLNLGRLTIYFKFNFLAWNIGLCRHKGTGYVITELITILGGSLMSVIISVFLILYMVSYGATDAMASIFGVFIFSAVWDFVVNLYPNEMPYQLHDGKQLYNDGAQLKRLIIESSFPDEYFLALKKANENKFSEAANDLEKILEGGFKKREIYQLICECYEKSGDLNMAEKYFEEYYNNFKFGTIDYTNLGSLFLKKGDYEEALNCFEKVLHKDFKNALVINKKGKALLGLGHAEKAIQEFTTAIHYQPNLVAVYRNRAFAKIKTGQLEEAYEDIQVAKKKGDKTPEVHLYLGKYFEKKRQYEEALEQYEKAKAMGVKYHGIDFDIAEIIRKIK